MARHKPCLENTVYLLHQIGLIMGANLVRQLGLFTFLLSLPALADGVGKWCDTSFKSMRPHRYVLSTGDPVTLRYTEGETMDVVFLGDRGEFRFFYDYENNKQIAFHRGRTLVDSPELTQAMGSVDAGQRTQRIISIPCQKGKDCAVQASVNFLKGLDQENKLPTELAARVRFALPTLNKLFMESEVHSVVQKKKMIADPESIPDMELQNRVRAKKLKELGLEVDVTFKASDIYASLLRGEPVIFDVEVKKEPASWL